MKKERGLFMFKRFLMVLLTMIVAIVAVLIAANNTTGETISFDEPVLFWIGLGTIILFFLPSLFLSFFSNNGARITSIIFQSFIALSFLGLIPAGALDPNGGVWASIIGIVGTIVSICSIAVTFFVGKNNANGQ